MLLTILIFLLLLSVLVLIHEFGHFLVAKKLGIKVEEFGFGFPPKALSFKKGETVYSINWLPIGGFVKLYGEDEAGAGRIGIAQRATRIADENRAFYARSAGQRLSVIIAGVVMNSLLAVFIYYLYFGISGFSAELPNLGDYNFLVADKSIKLNGIIITEVAKNSPADQAHLSTCGKKSCFKITEVNNQPIVSSEEFVNTVKENKGKSTLFAFEDLVTHKKFSSAIVPRINPPKGEGALGIGFTIDESIVLSYHKPVQKILSGIVHPINVMGYQFKIMAKFLGFSIKQKSVAPLSDVVSGPVGIFKIVDIIGQIPNLKERFLQYLNIAGILSSSLALFNILPIPALDGGRMFFILIEAVTGRKINEKYEALAHSIGMAVLLTLILLITFKDIFQFFR